MPCSGPHELTFCILKILSLYNRKVTGEYLMYESNPQLSRKEAITEPSGQTLVYTK